MKKLAIILTLLCAAAFAQKGTFTDSRDSQKYKTVKIGKQTWMAQNLNFKPETGSWCYDNNDANCEKYGRLYSFEAAKAACPAGWRLPSSEEWVKLQTATGKKTKVCMGPGMCDWEYTGSAKKLKAKTGWSKDDTSLAEAGSVNGTDNHGFSALPAGKFDKGKFLGIGSSTCWAWSDGESNSGMGAPGQNSLDDLDYCGADGLSIRCIKN